MKQDIEKLIDHYKKELVSLETRYLTEREAGRKENESYFIGQWCRLGNCLCDLQAIKRKKLESFL